jgi:hypothetical protein
VKQIDFIKVFTSEPEKVYTEKQWNDMENYYGARLAKEREQKDRAQQHVINLTESIKKKNDEIEKLNFFLEVSRFGLELAVLGLKDLNRQKNR